MPIYTVPEYKTFYDSRQEEKQVQPRVFCGDCMKPKRMLDDDCDEEFSKSDYCDCKRRGHD